MWIFVRTSDGHVYREGSLVDAGGGNAMLTPYEVAYANLAKGHPEITGPEDAVGFQITDYAQAYSLLSAPALRAVRDEWDRIQGVEVDPDWVPPAPEPDPIEVLGQTIAKNNLLSKHDKKWADQKDYLKTWGILWVKAHPTCTLDETVAAIETELATEFPGVARVLNIVGVLQSYADEALRLGVIAQATFPLLRDFVVGATNKQIRQLLRTM